MYLPRISGRFSVGFMIGCLVHITLHLHALIQFHFSSTQHTDILVCSVWKDRFQLQHIQLWFCVIANDHFCSCTWKKGHTKTRNRVQLLNLTKLCVVCGFSLLLLYSVCVLFSIIICLVLLLVYFFVIFILDMVDKGWKWKEWGSAQSLGVCPALLLNWDREASGFPQGPSSVHGCVPCID